MESSGYILLVIVFILIVIYALWIYNNHLSKIKESVLNFYKNKNLMVEDIATPGISERIKFQMPIVLYHHFFNYSFPLIFLRLNTFFYRKVNLINDRNKKQTAYIELKVRVKDNIEIEELKVFEL